MQDRELVEAESRQVGRRVREEIARRRISRQALADMARVSLSTLEKALAGTRPFTLATTIRLEEALGLVLRPETDTKAPIDLAPEHMGAYSRASIRWIEGSYLTLRPSFGTARGIYAYVTTLAWNGEAGHLRFTESQRIDSRFEQNGYVSMPSQSGHIYLVTNEVGQHRMMLLGRPTIDGMLYGVLSTLQVGQGSQLLPVASPVALTKLDRITDPAIGLIPPDHVKFADYHAMLDAAVADDFVRFYPQSTAARLTI